MSKEVHFSVSRIKILENSINVQNKVFTKYILVSSHNGISYSCLKDGRGSIFST